MKQFLTALLILLTYFCYSQECEHLTFEDGIINSSIQTFIGEIQSDGTIVINTEQTVPGRHTIMSINDGFDAIAELYCIDNEFLPVVSPDGGIFSFKLGNEINGAEAERIVVNFTVTPDLTLFLLKYAVILNDPNHLPYEQPRFNITIFDEAGNLFPCGDYLVVADDNIPGFENCSNGWRVRPWTTTGFELTSFLGQNITIEILTTDCAQGGHAGYAYIDASCQAFDFSFEGYCPQDNFIEVSVPDGFEDYVWFNGDTTQTIQIFNPTPGDPISVTLTSATGCEITISDTIPAFETTDPPILDSIPNYQICSGELVEITVTGENLNLVYDNYGDTTTFFQYNPQTTTFYQIVAFDSLACASDTVSFIIDVQSVEVDSIIIQEPLCFGEVGFAQINAAGLNLEYLWSDGNIGNVNDNIFAGNYNVVIIDDFGCFDTISFNVNQPTQLLVDSVIFTPFTCLNNNNAGLTSFVSGGTPPYSYLWSNGEITSNISNLTSGNYSLTVTDSNDCEALSGYFIPEPGIIEIELFSTNPTCYAGSDGQIIVEVNSGFPPYVYQWSNGETTQTIENLQAGNYSVTVTDGSGCSIEESVTLIDPYQLEFEVETNNPTCYEGSDGFASIIHINGQEPFSYMWNDTALQTTQTAINLYAGLYEVTVTDVNGCSNTQIFEINQPNQIETFISGEDVSCFGYSDGEAFVEIMSGQEPYSYRWSNNETTNPTINLSYGWNFVTITDSNNCFVTDSVFINQPNSLSATVDSILYPNCYFNEPGKVFLSVVGGTPQYKYLWSDSSTEVYIESFDNEIFQVTITDNNNCTIETEVETPIFEIDVEEDGLFTNELNGNNYICFGDSAYVSVFSNSKINNIKWTTNIPVSCNNCSTISALPSNVFFYTVEVEDIFGCIEQITGQIYVDKTCDIYVPNIFSPNNDGNNDWFFIQGRDNILIEEFKIFDRWGEFVWESCNNCSINVEENGWDGYFRGEQAVQGVYVWYAYVYLPTDLTNKIFLKGDVTLVR